MRYFLPFTEAEKEKKKEKVETAVLSITIKHRKKDMEKKKIAPGTSTDAVGEKMDVYVLIIRSAEIE